jgi:hypothetical protein
MHGASGGIWVQLILPLWEDDSLNQSEGEEQG